MKKLIVLTASRLLPGRSPMKITRRFAVASLLVIAVAVVLGSPAPASAGRRSSVTYVKLHPTADSPNRHATGTVALYPARTPPVVDAVAVSVSKLAPNASYYMPVTVHEEVWRYWSDYGGYYEWVGSDEYDYNVPIQTDANGNGQGWVGGSGLYGIYYVEYLIKTYTFGVYDPSGTLVLTSSR
jgi:hypothetical protein